jgi:methionyl-tRNA formyltransferase
VRLVILTTDTLHHAYFVREIAGRWPLAGVFLETKSLKAPFPTAHPFEAAREDYERAAWFKGKPAQVGDFSKTQFFPSMNDGSAVEALRRARPEALIVYGTGKLGPQVIDVCPAGILNLHGGDPEHYRGLDTHLWAIQRRDFGALSVTLHRVAAGLDTGDIVDQEAIPLKRGMGLHELRRYNAETCVRLVDRALTAFANDGRFPSRPQRKKGDYFSFMPAEQKQACVETFAAHTRALP